MKVSAIAFALLASTASAKTAPKKHAAAAEPTVRELMHKVEQLSKDLSTEREARKELTSKIQSLEKANAKGHNVRRRAEEILPDEAPEEIGYGALLSKILYLEEALTSLENCVDYSEYSGYATCTFGDDYNKVGVKILADTKIELYADNNIKIASEYGAVNVHSKDNSECSLFGPITLAFL